MLGASVLSSCGESDPWVPRGHGLCVVHSKLEISSPPRHMNQTQSHNPFLAHAAASNSETKQRSASSALEDLAGLDMTSPASAAPATPAVPTSATPAPTNPFYAAAGLTSSAPVGETQIFDSMASPSVSSPVQTSPFAQEPGAVPQRQATDSSLGYALSSDAPAASEAAPSMPTTTMQLSPTSLAAPRTATNPYVNGATSSAPPVASTTTYSSPMAGAPALGPIASSSKVAGAPVMTTAAPNQIESDAQLAKSLAAAEDVSDVEWPLRDIFWHGRETKIIMQNEQGPSSLISLCNYLLLQHQLSITPPDRPTVSYSYLSDMLSDYLLARSSGSTDASALSRVLAALPMLQRDLRVDVFFDSPTHFGAESGEASAAELQLVRFVGAALVHGCIAGPTDVAAHQARSYNVLSMRAANMGAEGLPAHQWLEKGGSQQLTSAGIEALQRALKPGQMGLLYRHAHLFLIYRRMNQEASIGAPALYLLVTDPMFLMDEQVVWESLVEPRHGRSQYFSSSFAPVERTEGEWESMAATYAGGSTEDEDYVLAMRLQNEERRRAATMRRVRREHREAMETAPVHSSEPEQSSSGSRFKKLVPKRILPSSEHQNGKNCKVM